MRLHTPSAEAGPESANARSAALMVHGLGAGDRQWVLQQLPQKQLAVLEPLLAELVALGLPEDANLVREVLGEGTAPGAPKAQEPCALMQAAARDLVQTLRDEHPNLIAVLLCGRQWPWHAEFLALLPPARRRLVEAALGRLRQHPSDESPVAGKMLHSALAQEVGRRLGRVRPPARSARTRLASLSAGLSTTWGRIAALPGRGWRSRA